jgi:hypothetical protein
LPASFEIVVKTRSDVLPVARRFFNDPLVDNDPGTHDGVAFARLSDDSITVAKEPSDIAVPPA